MAAPLDQFSRVRLEGRAELLEATRLRYRALRGILKSLLWKERFRRNSDLVREVIASEERVEEALHYARRRLEPSLEAALKALLSDVESQRAELLKLAAGRKKRSAGVEAPTALAFALSVLEEDVLRAALAGSLLPGERVATAVQLLPSSLPAVQVVARSGARLGELFQRPVPPDGKLPLSGSEADEVPLLLQAAERGLGELYQRLSSFDPSGTLVPYLMRQSRSHAVAPPSNGAEELLRTAFWVSAARGRMRELVAERLRPVEVHDHELLQVFAYVCRRSEGSRERLRLNFGRDGTETPRRALLELAHELWTGLGQGRPGPHRHGMVHSEPRWPEGFWDRVLQFAGEADGARSDAAYRPLCETLGLFVRIRARAAGEPAPDKEAPLLELTQRARKLALVRAV